jgi:hypothetical protein
MSDPIHVKHVIHHQRKPGLCACGKNRRAPGRGNCQRCNALAQSIYRARKIVREERARRAQMRAIADGVSRSEIIRETAEAAAVIEATRPPPISGLWVGSKFVPDQEAHE